jgi:two-component system, LytTR family, response regulator
MINSIIIDDELHCLETLSFLLKEYCPDVEIAERCRSGKSALEAIEKIKPDLIFLDVEMPGMNGFEMLEKLAEIFFGIIFTTSYDQYAIKAFRFSALDYLLKPINPKELLAAVQKFRKRKFLPSAEQFHMLYSKIQNREAGFTKIAIPTAEGFELVFADQIISCEADNNYTHLNLKKGRRIIACRTLKDIEEQLQLFPSFLRVHQSYIANLNEVSKYMRGEGGYLIMSDGSAVNVSRNRKEALLKLF